MCDNAYFYKPGSSFTLRVIKLHYFSSSSAARRSNVHSQLILTVQEMRSLRKNNSNSIFVLIDLESNLRPSVLRIFRVTTRFEHAVRLHNVRIIVFYTSFSSHRVVLVIVAFTKKNIIFYYYTCPSQ